MKTISDRNKDFQSPEIVKYPFPQIKREFTRIFTKEFEYDSICTTLNSVKIILLRARSFKGK